MINIIRNYPCITNNIKNKDKSIIVLYIWQIIIINIHSIKYEWQYCNYNNIRHLYKICILQKKVHRMRHKAFKRSRTCLTCCSRTIVRSSKVSTVTYVIYVEYGEEKKINNGHIVAVKNINPQLRGNLRAKESPYHF